MTSREVDVKSYYRRHDDYKRYLVANEKRVRELSRLYSENRKFFGKRVLDLACGAGVLGLVLGKHGHEYLGLDKNPDMIDEAEKITTNSINFQLGDARSSRVKGKFDTVTLLGNALIHFDTSEFLAILGNISDNLERGGFFLVDYRDIVSMLYSGAWNPNKTFNKTDKVSGKVIGSQSVGIDPILGNIEVQSLIDGRKSLVFTHAIWSPFIIQPIMESKGFKMMKRRMKPRNAWFDIYRTK
jgi:SAM-dependent methyltransferase